MAPATHQTSEREINQLRIALGLATLGLLLIALRAVLSRKRNDFPGPFCLPFLGSVGTLWRLQRRPDRELFRLRDNWGPICALQIGSKPALVISSPRVVKELLNERGSIYSSRPESDAFRSQVFPWRLLAMPHGPDFRHLRKLYNQYLSAQHSLLFHNYQDHESLVMLEDLLHRPGDFIKIADRYTMSIIFSAIYGVRIENLDYPVMKELYHFWVVQSKYFQPGTLPSDYLPFLLRLPKRLQPWHRELMPVMKRESEIHMSLIRSLRESMESGNAPDCFGKLILEAQEKESISDFQAYCIFAMFVVAGADTTGGFLQHFFRLMALNPEVVQKAHEELDRVVGPGRIPDWDDFDSLVYVRSLIKEIHRFSPLNSLGIQHYAMKDDIYEGKLIRKGTIIIPNTPALSRDPERYHDPDKFIPERFLDNLEPAAVSAVAKDHMKRDHFHFGFGRRTCPGIHVAESSLFIAISRLLWAYDIKPRPGCPLNIEERKLVFVWKPDPYHVDVVCRGESYKELIRQAPKLAGNGVLEIADVEIK